MIGFPAGWHNRNDKAENSVIDTERPPTFPDGETPQGGTSRRFRLHGLLYGLLQAGVVALLYLGISLLDPWGHVSDGLHAALYGAALGLMGLAFLFGLRAGWKPARTARTALLFGLSSVLVVGLFALLAGDDLARRLEAAARPRALFDHPVPHMTARLVPPAYTKTDPVELSGQLNAAGEEAFSAAGLNPVPQGSLLRVTIEGSRWRPELVAGGQAVPFTPEGAGSWVAELKIGATATNWQVRTGSRLLGRWPVILLQDEMPDIRQFDLEEAVAPLGLTPVRLDLSDDYGLAGLALEVSRQDAPEAGAARLDLPVRDVAAFSGLLYVDLSALDGAGQAATVTLLAEDQAGQVSRVRRDGVMLPKRQFRDMEAALLNDIREKLVSAPQDRPALARKVMVLGLVPGEKALPPAYYMGLRSAYWRLVKPSRPGDWEEARKILWDLALLLEYGESGQEEFVLLEGLDRLALALRQKKATASVLQRLRELDHDFGDFVRARGLSSDHQQKSVPDYVVVRRLYDRILAYVSRNRHDRALALTDSLRAALVADDLGVLTADGYGRFVAATQGTQIIENLITIQKQLLANSYKGRVMTELASTDGSGLFEARAGRQWKEWGATQEQLGRSLHKLGVMLVRTGLDLDDLLREADRLVGDALTSLKAGEMERAAQHQSQILVVLNNLKHRLGGGGQPSLLMRELAPEDGLSQ